LCCSMRSRTEGLEVTPILNSLESFFDKEGLREFGAGGLKRGSEVAAQMPTESWEDSFWASSVSESMWSLVRLRLEDSP
jgi:hypothetical protein